MIDFEEGYLIIDGFLINKETTAKDIQTHFKAKCKIESREIDAFPGVRVGWNLSLTSPQKVDNTFTCDYIECTFQGISIWLDSSKSIWETTEIIHNYMENVTQLLPSKTLQYHYHWICPTCYVRQVSQCIEIFFPKKTLGYLSPTYEELPEKIKEWIDTRAYE